MPGSAATNESSNPTSHRREPLSWLTALRASINFEAESVTAGASSLELRNVTLPVELRNGRFVVERGGAATDAGDIVLSGSYDQAAREVRATVRSKGISFADPPDPSVNAARLFPNKPFVPSWLPGITGVVDAAFERLDYRGTDLSAVRVNARLDQSRIDLDLRGALGAGRVSFNGTHAYTSGETRITATANAVQLDSVAAVREYLSGATLDGTATLSGHGRTARALAADLNGTVRAQIGRGDLSNVRLERLSQNLLAMTLRSVIPFKQATPHTPLECAALRLELTHGRIEDVPMIVARSDKLELIGRGTLDLGSEQIALKLQPAAKPGFALGGAGSPRTVSIKGPLRAPVVKSSAGDLLHESIAFSTSWATNPLARAADKVLARGDTRRTSCADALGN